MEMGKWAVKLTAAVNFTAHLRKFYRPLAANDTAMHRLTRMNDSVHFFMGHLTSRIVAESGVPTDRFHLGKIILQSLRDAPDFISQIDGATNESETNGSVLDRSIRCAEALRSLGLQKGDVIVLMAPNHLDVAIPYYAALYLGVIIAPVDRMLTVTELQNTFEVSQPEIVFCQNEKTNDVQIALRNLNYKTRIVAFAQEGIPEDVMSFSELLKLGDNASIDNFRAADFDPEETIAFIAATSGTTGLPKQAALTHKNLVVTGPYNWSRSTKFPSPTRMALVTSPLQWVSAVFHFNLSAVMRYTRLQSSLPCTRQHVYQLINTHRPTFMALSPNLMTNLMTPGEREQCDFTSFELILIAGSVVPQQLIDEIKQITPKTEVYGAYGATEVATSFVFHSDESPPPGSYGRHLGYFQYRLVDVETGRDIVEPKKPGELWLRGPAVFKGYHNNPEATEETFAEDGWFKTGDLFYRDEQSYFYFVERIKLLLKYNNYQVSPVEVEGVIRQNPGVLDVAVTGVPDPVCGDLVVACVVRRPGGHVTARQLKDLVKDTLTDTKQLRGGVIFMDELPMTASTKIDRRKLKELAMNSERE